MTTPDFVLRGVSHEYRTGGAALAGIDLEVLPGQHVASSARTGRASRRCSRCSTAWSSRAPERSSPSALRSPKQALEDPAFRRDFRARVGFVFQDADVQLFCSDVRDELAFGPLQLGLARDEVQRLVADVAAHLRIDKLLDRPPYSLSGGEKKRVAIAAIVTMHPRVLLLDEPTNALDPRSQVWLLDVLDEWKTRGRTVVMATHDLSAAAEAADRIVVLSEEHTIVADGAPADVLVQRDLLLSVNLIHEHTHRHASTAHRHAHAHGPGADPLSVHPHAHDPEPDGDVRRDRRRTATSRPGPRGRRPALRRSGTSGAAGSCATAAPPCRSAAAAAAPRPRSSLARRGGTSSGASPPPRAPAAAATPSPGRRRARRRRRTAARAAAGARR